MQFNRRKLLYGSFIALSIVGLAGFREEEQPLSQCQIVTKWVDENRANIPHTLSGLSKLPMAYRRAAFSTLPMSERRQAWREHMSSFLVDTTRFNAVQLDLLRTTLAHLNEYVDTTGAGKAARERDGLTIPRVKRVLGDSLANAIFGTLGPVDPAVKDQGHPTCECNTGSSFCTHGECNYLPSCLITRGCGWFWCEACDGMCPKAQE